MGNHRKLTCSRLKTTHKRTKNLVPTLPRPTFYPSRVRSDLMTDNEVHTLDAMNMNQPKFGSNYDHVNGRTHIQILCWHWIPGNGKCRFALNLTIVSYVYSQVCHELRTAHTIHRSQGRTLSPLSVFKYNTAVYNSNSSGFFSVCIRLQKYRPDK